MHRLGGSSVPGRAVSVRESDIDLMELMSVGSKDRSPVTGTCCVQRNFG